ncbi:phosphate regulon sensor histidine kinase PhoR [Pseudorhodoferax sp. Leaf274]|uniref:phosphate regulon sensor histidine kinase PhoR n=1 Tax=Pseudorhodoferax sp. Leaf274 TaxID=1736318 RepID=UPI000703B58C|nr:phosphate regulon sensor histidine kinase PhoR [Pseudorhodoferax sp. Leaf274]KQP35311.1 PAS domain-containing sensor histidine kinase [Pseudorhodoferax sp. Leaf274]
MWLRFTSFVVFLVAGAAAGWWLRGWPAACAGLLLAATAWWLVDALRAVRVLRGLREDETLALPRMGGLWGELADRLRRLQRTGERRLQASERRLQEFLEAIQASSNGVMLLDAEGRINWCNPTAASHFGIDVERDHEQLIGNLVRDPAFTSYYANPDPKRNAIVTGSGDSAGRPVRLAVRLHFYGEGRRLMLSNDVTALEQAEAMRRDFVANVSHEIRTPLTVLTGFVETLQSLPLQEDERARYLELMAQQASRMQTLVNDLLTLSRIEGSPPPGRSEWTRLGDLSDDCEDEAQALSALLTAGQGAPHALAFVPPPALALAGSRTELMSALSNLVSNAVRYTPAGGSVTVAWQALSAGQLEFAVEDTGPGVAPEHLPRLTERFYRVDRSRSRETGGTGLGLAIVKHVVQRHGAELRIQSTLGKGSRFAIVFPASRVRADAPVSANA